MFQMKRNMNDDVSKAKKRSRWGGCATDKILVPGMPTTIPQGLNEMQEKAYVLQLQVENLTMKLRNSEYDIPSRLEDRSPSPEPVYNSQGQRMNTREYRIRKKMEEERHKCIEDMKSVNPDYRPPADYKPPMTRISDRVPIPQDEHSGVNFVGLLIGPRGNTLKMLEKETGAKIMIRGKGSVKEGKLNRKEGQMMPGEDEPLHAMCYANSMEPVAKACKRIRDIIDEAISKPDAQNDLRKMQLRELAMLNGTYRGDNVIRCTNCGSEGHKSWQCTERENITNQIVCSRCGGVGHIVTDCRTNPEQFNTGPTSVDKAKMDNEYQSLMAELGEGPQSGTGESRPQRFQSQGPNNDLIGGRADPHKRGFSTGPHQTSPMQLAGNVPVAGGVPPLLGDNTNAGIPSLLGQLPLMPPYIGHTQLDHTASRPTRMQLPPQLQFSQSVPVQRPPFFGGQMPQQPFGTTKLNVAQPPQQYGQSQQQYGQLQQMLLSQSASPNVQQMSLNQQQIPISQHQMSLGQPQMPISQQQMSLSQPQMPISQQQMSLSQPQMPISQQQMPISQQQLYQVQRMALQQTGFVPQDSGQQSQSGPQQPMVGRQISLQQFGQMEQESMHCLSQQKEVDVDKCGVEDRYQQSQVATKPGFDQNTQSGFGENTPDYGQLAQAAYGQTAPSRFSQNAATGFGQSTTAEYGQGASAGFSQGMPTGRGQKTDTGFSQSNLSGFSQNAQSGFQDASQRDSRRSLLDCPGRDRSPVGRDAMPVERGGPPLDGPFSSSPFPQQNKDVQSARAEGSFGKPTTTAAPAYPDYGFRGGVSPFRPANQFRAPVPFARAPQGFGGQNVNTAYGGGGYKPYGRGDYGGYQSNYPPVGVQPPKNKVSPMLGQPPPPPPSS